jgi:hypothetical protein
MIFIEVRDGKVGYNPALLSSPIGWSPTSCGGMPQSIIRISFDDAMFDIENVNFYDSLTKEADKIYRLNAMFHLF